MPSHHALRLPLLVAAAQASVRLKCNTTVGVNDGILEVDLWPGTAAHGVRRIIAMAEDSFFSNLPFFQVLENMITFGLQPDSEKQLEWNNRGDIPDDPMPPSNPFDEGLLCFSGDPGKRDDSRSTILFFTLGNKHLMANRKTPWEVPVGKVIKGLDVIKSIYAGYGDEPQFALLNPTATAKNLDGLDGISRRWAAAAAKSADAQWARYPKLDRILSCHIERDSHPTTDPNPRSSKDEL